MNGGAEAVPGLKAGLLGIVVLVALLAIAADHAAPPAAGQATMTTEDVVTGASFPVTLAFAPDGRLFYAELCSGNVRIVLPDDTLLPDPFVNVGSVLCFQDYGFIGLALDPDFETNHYVYVQYMELTSSAPLIWRPLIKRFTEANNVGTDPTVLFTGPETDPTRSKAHGADNIHFGLDGYLYTSIGDLDKNVGEVQVSQDLSRLEGKILRLDKTDGSAPPDNPFANTPGADPRVYAYGFRNSFGFTFHDENGMLYATENGPDRCDELNIVVAGGNYGWPIPYESTESCAVPVGIQAIYWFTFFLGYPPWASNHTSAPTGIEYIDGDTYPALGHSLLVCNWRNSQMRHLTLAPSYDAVTGEQTLLTDCSLDVQINPLTGAIYYTNAGAIRRLLVDSDSDTVIDGADNCPDTANSGQENSVHPLTPAGDHCEDPEPDGVFDMADNCPDTANPGQENNVHPGTPAGDHCEDPEPDTVMDFFDNCPEIANGGQENTDGDQWGDACDNCPDTANSGQENGVHPLTPAGDHCEDPEPDGVFDAADNCPDMANPGQQNAVHPGTPAGDHCEDPEPDGVFDLTDNCPDVANPGQQNSVHPGTPAGDHCEDPEPDTVMDFFDNCPNIANGGQENTDGDQWGDACDNCPATATAWLAPAGDDDCDGFPSTAAAGGWGSEAFIGTDPADPCPDDATDDAWPTDFNMNTTVNIIDVLFFATPISGEYDSRYDLNANGVVNIIDVLMFAPFIMQSCTNP